DAARLQRSVADDLLQDGLRVVVELTGGRLVEDGRELSFQLPGVEEELPVDVLPEGRELRLGDLRAREGRLQQLVERDAFPIFARLFDREQRFPLLLGVLLAQALLELAVLVIELFLPWSVKEARDDPDD